jgi:uncharacterized protein DUF1566
MNTAAQAITPAAANVRFIDNGDGTVTDTLLSLMWSKATLCEEEVNHADAEKLCSELTLAGHTDWRLPTVDELSALADRSRYNPAIDKDAFPDTQSDWYWTSTSTAWSSDCAWIVVFGFGGVGYGLRRDSGNAFVRAVRSVPAGQ